VALLVWLIKFLVATVLTKRDEDHSKVLTQVREFYEKQAREERDSCQENYQKLHLSLEKLASALSTNQTALERLLSR